MSIFTGPSMPGNVFISYRREDTAGHAGRLYDHLKACFPGRVFIDVGAIPPGADFVKAIELQVGNCAALVALIGNRWATDDRLHNPEDFVRIEIASALKRDVKVIPLLVESAKLPAAATLPDDIQPLLRRQAISIKDDDWEHGCDRLIKALEEVLGPGRKSSNRKPWIVAAAVSAVAILSLLTVMKLRNAASPAPIPSKDTRAAVENYDKSVANAYKNATDVMDNVANQIAGQGSSPPLLPGEAGHAGNAQGSKTSSASAKQTNPARAETLTSSNPSSPAKTKSIGNDGGLRPSDVRENKPQQIPATNFGTAINPTNLVASVPYTAPMMVSVNTRQVTAGTGCGAGTSTAQVTIGYTAPGGTSETVTANTLMIAGNGAVDLGSTSAQVLSFTPKAGTAVRYSVSSTLNPRGCTTSPQYAVDISVQ